MAAPMARWEKNWLLRLTDLWLAREFAWNDEYGQT